LWGAFDVCVGNGVALLGGSIGMALKTLKFFAAACGFLALAFAGVHGLGLLALRDGVESEGEKPRKAAAETLVCPESQIQIRDRLATGCGRTCTLREVGSSASWFSSYGCEVVP
jgi:hypothetical protein